MEQEGGDSSEVEQEGGDSSEVVVSRREGIVVK